MNSLVNSIKNNISRILILSIWSYTGYIAYNKSIDNGHDFEESIKVAIITFPLCVIFFCLYAMYVVSPAFIWGEIFEKISTDNDFDFFEIMFLFGQCIEE
tara:strand:+ start:144 stop:443 length:300 start_codon:yes stop_codon:yes gene_type:complete